MFKRFLNVVTLFGCAAAVLACSDPVVPGGKITVRNDILDKEYNVIRVDQISTNSGGGGGSFSIKPGEGKLLPYKHIRKMRFSRKYKDHTNVYMVECPKDFDKEISINLIDVHTNRIRGGCELIKRGTVDEGGYTHWEK